MPKVRTIIPKVPATAGGANLAVTAKTVNLLIKRVQELEKELDALK